MPTPQVDPTLTRADRLVGQVLGAVGALPEVYSELEINFFLLRRLLGVRSKEGEKQSKVGGSASGGAAWLVDGFGVEGHVAEGLGALCWKGIGWNGQCDRVGDPTSLSRSLTPCVTMRLICATR